MSNIPSHEKTREALDLSQNLAGDRADDQNSMTNIIDSEKNYIIMQYESIL